MPVFIACNKSDRMNALSPEFIRKRLEKEMWVPVRIPAPTRIRLVGSPSLTPDAHASLSSSPPTLSLSSCRARSDVILKTTGDLSDTREAVDQAAAITKPGASHDVFRFADCLCSVTYGGISGSKGNVKSLAAFLGA